MSLEDTHTGQPRAPGPVCVIVVSEPHDPRLQACLESIAGHEPALAEAVTVATATREIDEAMAAHPSADVLILDEPCLWTPGILSRLQAAAYADTNTASASALTDTGGPLALSDTTASPQEQIAMSVAADSLRLRPRLTRVAGPCVYIRRDALQLVGNLDRALSPTAALEVDFAQRCLLIGLAHIAADDAVVIRIAPPPPGVATDSGVLRERYEYLQVPAPAPEADPEPLPPEWAAIAASPALPRALEAARRGLERLPVTIDGRALGSALTGTQRHVLELIRALAASGELALRVLVGPDTSAEARDQLRALPGVSLLEIADIDRETQRSAIFHRAQQVFETEDLRIALRLGERLVLNQLDLIAYRNPGYHADGIAWRRYRRVTRQALAVADRVLVFSNHTLDELLSDELIDPDRARIVPPGLDHGAEPGRTDEARPDAIPPQTAHELEQAPFILCLGTDFRHKNRLFALRLVDALRERRGWPGRLVFAGTHVPHGSSRPEERALLDAHPALRDVVADLGAIDEATKGWLMANAAAVLYPSVYEGFGLVPLEAALQGVPSLFAAQASLAEVLPPDTATLIPWDPEVSAERTLELLEDDDARRRQLDTLLKVATTLTWRDSARATLETYREAVVAPVRESTKLSRDELQRERELRALVEAQDAMVAQLAGERDQAVAAFDALRQEAGFGLSLIGPNGALPEDAQRGLLALSARPGISRPLFLVLVAVFRVGRAGARLLTSRRPDEPT